MLRTQFDKSWHQSTQGTGKGHNKQSLGQAETTTLEKLENIGKRTDTEQKFKGPG